LVPNDADLSALADMSSTSSTVSAAISPVVAVAAAAPPRAALMAQRTACAPR
jgi:hypothetical protein